MNKSLRFTIQKNVKPLYFPVEPIFSLKSEVKIVGQIFRALLWLG